MIAQLTNLHRLNLMRTNRKYLGLAKRIKATIFDQLNGAGRQLSEVEN